MRKYRMHAYNIRMCDIYTAFVAPSDTSDGTGRIAHVSPEMDTHSPPSPQAGNLTARIWLRGSERACREPHEPIDAALTEPPCLMPMPLARAQSLFCP